MVRNLWRWFSTTYCKEGQLEQIAQDCMWVLNSVKDRDSSARGVNLHHHLTPSYSRSVFFVIVSMAYLVSIMFLSNIGHL